MIPGIVARCCNAPRRSDRHSNAWLTFRRHVVTSKDLSVAGKSHDFRLSNHARNRGKNSRGTIVCTVYVVPRRDAPLPLLKRTEIWLSVTHVTSDLASWRIQPLRAAVIHDRSVAAKIGDEDSRCNAFLTSFQVIGNG